MPPEEAARYRLDDCLGGTSATIHQVRFRFILKFEYFCLIRETEAQPYLLTTISQLISIYSKFLALKLFLLPMYLTQNDKRVSGIVANLGKTVTKVMI